MAIGGPVLFLIGCAFFKRASSTLRNPPFSHLVGLVLFTGLTIWAWFGKLTVLETGALATAVLILTAVWEWLSLNGGWQRWTPWMQPVLGRFTRPN